MAPIVLQLVAELPVDEWGRLEAGFDVERHLAGRSFQVRLDDGSWAVLEAVRFAPFAEAFLEAQGLLDFHRADAGRLFALAEALEGSGAPWTGGRELLDLGARLRALAEAPEEPSPAALKGELRPYQRTGYGWLKALCGSGFGGVLADDMGLGKTVQTLPCWRTGIWRRRQSTRACWWCPRAWSATGGARPRASCLTSSCWCCTDRTGGGGSRKSPNTT